MNNDSIRDTNPSQDDDLAMAGATPQPGPLDRDDSPGAQADGDAAAEFEFLDASSNESSRQQQVTDAGCQLRDAREQQGLALQDAAERLRLPWRVVERLEAGRWEQIGTPVFLRGYVRSYARLLGLPVAPLLAPIEDQVVIPQPLAHASGMPRQHRLLRHYARAATYLVITATIVVPIIYLGVNGGLEGKLTQLTPLDSPALLQPGDGGSGGGAIAAAGSHPERQQTLMASMAPIGLLENKNKNVAPDAAASSTVNPAVGDAAGAEPAMPQSTALTIRLTGPCWVEVTGAGGQQLEYALLKAGSHVYQSDGTLTVRLGNAGAAVVKRGGEELDLRGYRHANIAYFEVGSGGDLQAPVHLE